MLPKPLQDVADALRQLPQIGPRQAGRLALFLFRQPTLRKELTERLEALGRNTARCSQCFRVAEENPCSICQDAHRDRSILMVVEEDADFDGIEQTRAFRGTYAVLGGRFSPARGMPEEQGLRIRDLVSRVAGKTEEIREIILAMNPTPEGEALAQLLTQKLKPLGVKLTRLGRGLPVGGEIEYADEETLRGALAHREVDKLA